MGSIDTILRATQRVRPSHKLYMPFSSIPVWKVLWRRYCQWQSMRRSREALRQLSNEQLRDIGITRAQAQLEARKGALWF